MYGMQWGQYDTYNLGEDTSKVRCTNINTNNPYSHLDVLIIISGRIGDRKVSVILPDPKSCQKKPLFGVECSPSMYMGNGAAY